MIGTMTTLEIKVVLIQEGRWWSAQCLDYDIAAQARSLPDLAYELQRILIAHLAVAEELNQTPFKGLSSAPQKYWDIYSGSKIRLNIDDLPFRPAKPAAVSVEMKFRVAQVPPAHVIAAQSHANSLGHN
jgi:hypothetical protein